MPRLPISPLELVKAAKAITGRLGSSTETKPRAVALPTVETALLPAEQPVAAEPATRVGKYDDALVELVGERPGILVAVAAEQIGVHPTALYPVVRRLETHGRFVKLGRELHPPSAANREQLWCEEGRSWTRPTVRGRKPKRCSEHR